jgi:hypothetical protein
MSNGQRLWFSIGDRRTPGSAMGVDVVFAAERL